MNKFYTAEEKNKYVSRDEFKDFVDNYPRKLDRDVYAVYEPPLLTYNDFELANRWPYSVVAWTFLYDDEPGSYYYCPETEKKYGILENFEECFDSKTGFKEE